MKTDKEKYVHKVFENISNEYDELNDIISFKQHKVWRKDANQKLNVQSNERVLDVCCGTGDWTIQHALKLTDGFVTGLDFSRNMLNIGKDKISKHNVENIEFIEGNAMELPFDNNTFDVVSIGFGLRNVPDYEKALQEIYRVLKPGGRLACLETSQPTKPIIKEGFQVYFKYIMPVFGKLFAKKQEEYNWLQKSTFGFLSPKELAKLFAQVGFDHIEYKTYSFGASALHYGVKQK